MLDLKYFILLPSLADVGQPFPIIQWTAVLKSVSGFEMYANATGHFTGPHCRVTASGWRVPGRCATLLYPAGRSVAACHHRHARGVDFCAPPSSASGCFVPNWITPTVEAILPHEFFDARLTPAAFGWPKDLWNPRRTGPGRH